MKKRIVLVSVALILLSLFSFAFACAPHQHNYTSAVTKDPTCTEKGVITFTCDCGDSYTEETEALGHNYSGVLTLPTCTEKGFTTYTCSRCNDTYVADETETVPHDYVGKVTRDPTHTEKGEKTFVCSVCNDTYTEEIDVIPYADAQYKVQYFVENLEDEGYHLKDTEILVAKEESEVFAEVKRFEHYSPVTESVSGVVKADGSLVLNVYYKLERHLLRIVPDSHTAASLPIEYDGTFKYGFTTASIVASFTSKTGYEWQGWIKNGEFLSSEYSLPPFVLTEDTEIIAKTIKPEMEIFDFTVNGEECKIVKLLDNAVEKVVIPDYVTEIGNEAFAFCENLKSVKIGGKVRSIGNSAFQYCKGLTELTVPNNVSFIGDTAFAYCDGLKSIILPEGLSEINPYTFTECRALTRVVFPSTLKKIGDSAFYYCTRLVRISLPDGLEYVMSSAFRECSGLVGVTLGKSLKSIGGSAFNNCYKLVEVINDSALNIVKGASSYGYIGYYAKAVHKGDSVLEEKDDFIFFKNGSSYYVMGYTGHEKELTVPERINGETFDVYDYAFNRLEDVESITLPEGVKKIGASAFEFCKSLTFLSLPHTVESVGKDAFINCKIENLKVPTVAIPYVSQNFLRSVTVSGGSEIPENAFTNALLLESVTISSSVERIGRSAFSGLKNVLTYTVDESSEFFTAIDGNLYSKDLTEFYRYAVGKTDDEFALLSSVKTIKEHAFDGSAVTVLYNGDSELDTIEDYAFSDYKGKTVTIPDSVESMTSTAFYNCTSVENATLPTRFIGAIPKVNLRTVKLSSGTDIPQKAFYGCGLLENVYLCESLLTVGKDAFSECPKLNYNHFENATYLGSEDNPFILLFKADSLNLTACDIHADTKIIGREAFKSCSSLEEIAIPNGVRSIGLSAFQNCSALLEVVIPDSVVIIEQNAFNMCTGIKTVSVGNGVTSIGRMAFANCEALSSVYLPSSIEKLDSRIFYNCKNLNRVYFDGDADAWQKIQKHNEWRFGAKFTLVLKNGDEIHNYES